MSRAVVCVLGAVSALALSASASAKDGFEGVWRLTVDRQGAPRVGLLEFEKSGNDTKVYIDGGPAPAKIEGDAISIEFDWEDGGGLHHVSKLDGKLADGAISGLQSDASGGAAQGKWSAVPETPKANGAPPAPIDLSGVYFDSTFDGTAKYTFELTDEAKHFQANFDPMLDDPSLRCVSDGLPRVTGGPFAVEIIQQPGRITLLYEDMHSIRRIYTDGRGFPEGVDDLYSSLGYSIGHWEGSTLVVETRGLRESIWHRSGTPYSSSAHVTEHFWKREDGKLMVDMTLEDPVDFERPIKRTTVWEPRPGYELQEYDCDPHAFYRAIKLDGRLDKYWDRSEFRR